MSAWRKYAVILGLAVLGIGALMPGAAAQLIDFEGGYTLSTNWTAPGWQIDSVPHGTSSNNVIQPSGANPSPALLTNPAPVGGDYSVLFDMAGTSGVAPSEYGFVFHYVDEKNNYRVTTKAGVVTLYRVLDGDEQVLDTASPDPGALANTSATWSSVRLIVVGTTINISFNGLPILFIDSGMKTPIDQGFFGLFSSGRGVVFDNVLLGMGGTLVTAWDDCLVTPHPVGKAAPGGLRVKIRCQGAAPTIYAVPQGINPASDTTHVIHFENDNTVPPPLPADTHYYRNLDPITTVWGSDADPIPGDILMDGHAVIHIFQSPEPPGDPTGRHFLIDTVPPRVQVVPPGPPVISWFLNAGPNSAPYAALGLAMPGGNHPYPALPTSCSQMLGTALAPYVSAPCAPDWTGSSPVDLASEDPKAFYNAHSFSNGDPYNQPALNVVVKTYLEDPDVRTAFNLGPDSQTDCVWYYGSAGPQHRQAAGFDVSKIPTDPQDATKVLIDGAINVDEPFPAMWLLQEGLATIATTSVMLQGQAFGSGLNSGYFSYSESDQLLAQWSFFYKDAGDNWQMGIPLANVADRMHLAGMFVGRDRARNRTDQNPVFMYRNDLLAPLRPLHVWWLLGNDVTTQVQVTAQTGMFPTLNWRLNRSYDLGIDYSKAANPKPLYTFRIYACPDHGKANKDAVPYQALQGWAPWSPDNLGLDAAYFQQILMPVFSDPNTLLDRWLLVVAAVCDEAGNVEAWDPGLAMTGSTADAVTPPAGVDSGLNWVRFYVPGNSASLDTKLKVDLKYETLPPNSKPVKDWGAATLIPYPAVGDLRVAAFCDITAVVPNVPPPDQFADAHVIVELEVDGAVAYRAGLTALGGVVHVQFPDAAAGPPSTDYYPLPDELFPGAGFVLGSPSKVMNYVVKATTYASKVDVNGNPVLLVADTTPASFAFKVVPGSIEKYLESGEQPVKVFERE